MIQNKVLAVVAHPDDEVLGCGGTLARHAKDGADVNVLILADGVGSRFFNDNTMASKKEVTARENMTLRAAELMGIKKTIFLRLPDNKMDSIPLLDIIREVEDHIKQFCPNIIYTHHSGDVNIDHRLTHEAVITVCRPQPGFNVSTILCFESPSSTEWQPPKSNTPFAPDWFVDISGELDIKRKALKEYSSEVRQWPHTRSEEAVVSLARWRGASVGVAAAEAFVLARHIEKVRLNNL